MLNNDAKWQNGSVALVDFEDGTGSCANGNADVNTAVQGMVAHGDYTGVRLVLGAPFDNNHGDAATAESPLNVTTMFWSWQSGYKFLRVDGKADNGGFRVNLGSTGCMMGANDTVESCTNSNRPVIEFDEFNVESDVVNVDIGKLFEALDMTPDADGNSAVCMSTPDHTPCNQVFPELGLPFGTTAAAAQAVFSKK